jgi:hypothetical protein
MDTRIRITIKSPTPTAIPVITPSLIPSESEFLGESVIVVVAVTLEEVVNVKPEVVCSSVVCCSVVCSSVVCCSVVCCSVLKPRVDSARKIPTIKNSVVVFIVIYVKIIFLFGAKINS